MKLKKLDRRMNGYGDFKYAIDFNYKTNNIAFDDARQWCWETFGASTELDIWELRKDTRNPKWAWDRGQYSKTYRCMIYLATDEEASFFTLKWL